MRNPVFGSPMQNPVCGPLQNLVHQPMWNRFVNLAMRNPVHQPVWNPVCVPI